jgi:hypothetical protein
VDRWTFHAGFGLLGSLGSAALSVGFDVVALRQDVGGVSGLIVALMTGAGGLLAGVGAVLAAWATAIGALRDRRDGEVERRHRLELYRLSQRVAELEGDEMRARNITEAREHYSREISRE